jgi:hypothetical protein
MPTRLQTFGFCFLILGYTVLSLFFPTVGVAIGVAIVVVAAIISPPTLRRLKEVQGEFESDLVERESSLPLPGREELAQPAQDERAVLNAQPIEGQDPVQVVDLVLQDPRAMPFKL